MSSPLSGPSQEDSNVARVPKRQKCEDGGAGDNLRLVQSADNASGGTGIPVAMSWPYHSATLNTCVEKMVREEGKKAGEGDPPIKLLASRLSDYLAPGGTKRFHPRFEWIHPSVSRCGKRPRMPQRILGSQSSSLPDEAPQGEGNQGAILSEPSAQAPSNDGLLPSHLFAELQVLHARTLTELAEEDETRLLNVESDTSPQEDITTSHTFGRDCDSALLMAIRENAIDAALELIQLGAPVNAENGKHVTPLILACQKGSMDVVQALLPRGANVLAVTLTGSTALLQSCHFGHIDVITLLLERGAMIEMANHKNTTPLMRAAQEGHEDVVRLLLSKGAHVNRRNSEQMSALMLAAQRGHARIVEFLLEAKADVDVMTAQRSTSLMLACKREHIDVMRVLISFGCELYVRNYRGRAAADEAARKNRQDLLMLLEPDKQIELMQRRARKERNYVIARTWKLLEQDRASVCTPDGNVSLRDMPMNGEACYWSLPACRRALVRAMTLPEHIVDLVASFMPLPRLWDERLSLITKRCGVDTDVAVSCAMDLIDEVLEEGGFLDACHLVNITPPTHFKSWKEWQSWGRRHNHLDPLRSLCLERANALDPSPWAYFARPVSALNTSLPGSTKVTLGATDVPQLVPMNSRNWRRGICYLQILAHRSPLLPRALTEEPFSIPPWLVDQLISVNDIQSLSRRLGNRGTHFEAYVAIELVMLASSVVSWHGREIAGLRRSSARRHETYNN